MRTKILQLLRNGEEVSGQYMSSQLGISRAAISKHILALRQEGYHIAAVTRRGYRLISAPDTLSAAEIGCRLRQPQAPWNIEYTPSLHSTTAELRERAVLGAPHGQVLIAEQQLDGKGRLGRSWYSPPGCGIWMSLLLRPPFGPQLAQAITLTAACAVAIALKERGHSCAIKWPNDILTPDGRKLVGIKSEMCADMDGVQWLITGIGINVNNSSFPEQLQQTATSLYLAEGKRLARAPIAAAVLDEIYLLYQQLIHQGFQPIREIWLQHAITLGHNIRISDTREEYLATALDLDENGCLIVERDGKLHTIISGDISLAD